MATRTGTRSESADGIAVTTVWEGITESDEGNGMGFGNLWSHTVQAVGDFTTSGAITMEGSNDGTNYSTLHDPQGNDVVLSDETPINIVENPLYIRPKASAGSAVDMDVYLVSRKYR